MPQLRLCQIQAEVCESFCRDWSLPLAIDMCLDVVTSQRVRDWKERPAWPDRSWRRGPQRAELAAPVRRPRAARCAGGACRGVRAREPSRCSGLWPHGSSHLSGDPRPSTEVDVAVRDPRPSSSHSYRYVNLSATFTILLYILRW